MYNFWFGVVIGLFIGANLGVFAIGLFAGRNYERNEELWFQKNLPE